MCKYDINVNKFKELKLMLVRIKKIRIKKVNNM